MTIDNVNLKDLPKNLKELAKKLNTTTSYDEDYPKDSIMIYEEICSCDTGFLCGHRLQYILDYINKEL